MAIAYIIKSNQSKIKYQQHQLLLILLITTYTYIIYLLLLQRDGVEVEEGTRGASPDHLATSSRGVQEAREGVLEEAGGGSPRSRRCMRTCRLSRLRDEQAERSMCVRMLKCTQD